MVILFAKIRLGEAPNGQFSGKSPLMFINCSPRYFFMFPVLKLALVCTLALFTARAAQAGGTFTWSGNAAGTNWKDPSNWGGTAPSGNAGEALVFPSGAAKLTDVNDFT